MADAYDGAEWKAFVADYQKNYPVSAGGFPSPSLFAYVYYVNMKAALDGLDAVKGDLSGGQAKYREALSKMVLKTPTGDVKLDGNRQAIGTTFVTEVVKDAQGNLFNKVHAQGRQRRPDARHEEGGVQDGLARRAGLPLRGSAKPWPRSPSFARARAAAGGPGARGARAAPRAALASNDALVLRGVTRAFGALRAVDDVSLTVAAGEKYAILGSNGAGKTTLFNAITGDFPPTAGRIHFFGEDITELPPHERIRKGLRRTYQSSLLFRDLTVRDNLFLAVRGVASGRFSLRRPRARPRRRSVATRRPARARAPEPHRRRARGQPGARPAAPARDRHGAGRRAAPDPVRRAGRRPVAGRAARAGRAADARCRRT